MEDIYLSDFNQKLNRVVVVEGDQHSIWAYLLKEDQKGIDFEGFLCSRGTMIQNSDEIQQYMEAGMAPPLFQALANEFSVQEAIENKDITIIWKNQAANIFINEVLFLILDTENRVAYSKAVAEDSPYGLVLPDAD